MKSMAALILSGVLLLGSFRAPAAENLNAFPAADPGMVRYVLYLPKQDDESDFRVELIVGKTVEVDEHNQYFFAGRIEQETLSGWGYPRYIIRQLGPMAGTLMAIDPAAPKVDRFVALGGERTLIRYNSRLPVVVYAPTGAEVRYRLWSASLNVRAMEEG